LLPLPEAGRGLGGGVAGPPPRLPALLRPPARAASGAAGGAVRRDPPPDAGRGQPPRPRPARAALPRQAAPALLADDGELPTLRGRRLVGPPGAGPVRRAERAAGVPVGPPRRRGARRAVRRRAAVPDAGVRLPRTDADARRPPVPLRGRGVGVCPPGA